MVTRLTVLTVASAAVVLSVSYYAHHHKVQTGAEVGPNGVLAVTPSDVHTSSVIDVDGRVSESRTQDRNLQKPSDVEYIAYRHVFAYIYSEEHGQKRPNQNVNSAVEYFKHTVPLTDADANVLMEIALETETHTLEIEEQAATIIRRFRAKIDAELKSGRKPPPEPSELETLQKERVRTTLQGREALRKTFGESTFSRFDTFLKESMNLKIEKAISSPQNN